MKRGEGAWEGTGPEGEIGGKNGGKKGGRKGARKRIWKTLILVLLWFRYSLASFQKSGRFASSFPPLRHRAFERKNGPKRANLFFEGLLSKLILNWSGSVFTLLNMLLKRAPSSSRRGTRDKETSENLPLLLRNVCYPRQSFPRSFRLAPEASAIIAPKTTKIQGELKVTDLRWQRKPKTQIAAENCRFSQIRPFSWKFQHLEGAGNRRKPQIFAGNRRFSQKTADGGASP